MARSARFNLVIQLTRFRSGTPLIYRAIPAWFVRVQPIVDQLVANNSETRWVPQHVGEGRFGNFCTWPFPLASEHFAKRAFLLLQLYFCI